MRILLAVILLAMLPFESALATNGYALLKIIRLCDSNVFSEPYDPRKCGQAWGYIEASVELQRSELNSCVPSRISLEKIVEITESYLEQNTELLDQHAAPLVIEAINNGWPPRIDCPQK